MRALPDITDDDALKDWRVRVEGGWEIHEVAVDAAATARLIKVGKFPRAEFLREVERIAKERY